MGGEKRILSFGITGEFITQIAREWFYSGEKSIEKIMEILVDSMTGTDTPKAQIRRYAEDILMGRAALKAILLTERTTWKHMSQEKRKNYQVV